jgi:hypothetical protein
MAAQVPSHVFSDLFTILDVNYTVHFFNCCRRELHGKTYTPS